jgi:hypothetical protein
MHPSSTMIKDKENVAPNISHTSANITQTLFAEKHDNHAPPSAPSSTPTRYIATNTLVNQSKMRSGKKTAQEVLTEMSFLNAIYMMLHILIPRQFGFK